MWGDAPYDWAKKYWECMNAFNTSYEGVSTDDFLECWIMWDKMAMDFYESKDKSGYRFATENPDKPKSADFG